LGRTVPDGGGREAIAAWGPLQSWAGRPPIQIWGNKRAKENQYKKKKKKTKKTKRGKGSGDRATLAIAFGKKGSASKYLSKNKKKKVGRKKKDVLQTLGKGNCRVRKD